MNNKTASLFVLIAAIFNYIVAGIIILASLMLLILSSIPEFLANELAKEGINLSVGTISTLGLLLGILILALAFIQLRVSKKMKNKKTLRNGSIWALVLGIITIGNVSGILCLIGGIIGLSESK